MQKTMLVQDRWRKLRPKSVARLHDVGQKLGVRFVEPVIIVDDLTSDGLGGLEQPHQDGVVGEFSQFFRSHGS